MFNRTENTNFTIPAKYHVLFWGSYFILNFIRWGSYFNDYWYSLKSNLVEFPLHIVIVYFNIYYLVPLFILKKRYKRYVLFFIVSLFLLYVIRTGLIYFLVTKDIWPEAQGVQTAFTFNHIVAVLLGEIYVIGFASAIKFTFDWVVEKRKNDKLKKVQLRTELNFLKSQIQPHFFFNTLNNLYALILKKSESAPSVVLKLSDIMQYVLYDVRESHIRLFDEINYIQNYLDLERLRYGDTIESSTEIIGSIDDIDVPPLLFLPFIENCFKHGTKDNDNIKLDIIFRNIDDQELEFRIENTFSKKNIQSKKHGIGIENVKRRLQLLFQDRFLLQTSVDGNKYNVLMKIPIL